MHPDILSPSTLRGRLSLAYASALILALLAFACAALVVLDRAQRVALDAQLESTADALRIVGDDSNGHLTVDAGDRAQFHTIVGSKVAAAVIGTDGSVLVSNDERGAAFLAPLVKSGTIGAQAVRGPRGESLRAFVVPIVIKGKPLGLALTWSDIAPILALDRSVGMAFALAIPLIAGLAVVAGSEIARRGLMPLERIAHVASEIEAKDLSRRLRLPARTDELGRLSATFDRMLDRLQGAFDRERRFTSDASHELRAPLSVIRAEADLALRAERTPAEYQRALETIASEADALEALTRDLLAAARNGDEAEDVRAEVDLSAVASTVVERVGVLAAARRVGIGLSNGTHPTIAANRALIERAVLCVLDNALKYSPEAGKIEICVTGGGSTADVTVRDEGPGFSEAALHQGFERFWRDDEARQREGSGLGLSLAKAIVERYGGAIALGNAEPHGALVRLSFPLLDSPEDRSPSPV